MTASASPEYAPAKRPVVRLWLVTVLLAAGGFLLWLGWPDSGLDVLQMSHEDGQSRFYVTTYPTIGLPANASLIDHVFVKWLNLKQRHLAHNPAAYTIGPSATGLCSMSGLLNQCMEMSGTRYCIAVEACAADVTFGHTNTMNGVQFLAAFEHAIETSEPVMCYDYAKKKNFPDTLVLIREGPHLVKIVPRSKLADYQKAGLVKSNLP